MRARRLMESKQAAGVAALGVANARCQPAERAIGQGGRSPASFRRTNTFVRSASCLWAQNQNS